MKFCDYCGRRISLEQYNNNKKCPKCDNKQDGTTVQATVPKVTTSIPKVTPLPPEQVDSTKPAPTYKELIPHLKKIADRLNTVLHESKKNNESTDLVAKRTALKRINS